MNGHALTIAGRSVGPGHPVYIIAEMSGNHGHSLSKAKEIVHAMKEAGADAVKLQTYTADTLTIDSDRPEFRVGKDTLWEGKTLYELYKEAYTPWEWQPELKQLANDLGMDLFSTPFDDTAVTFLESMNVPAYKIASFEMIDTPLIRTVAATGKPVIISTGMGSRQEIAEALDAAKGCDVALLKCTSAYPAPRASMNLRTIPDMMQSFGMPVGLSDHTLGTDVPVAAVKLGACIIEKHFCMSRKEPGPDVAFSLEPKEFAEMVLAVRTVESGPKGEKDIDPALLGEVRYGASAYEESSIQFRRSLFVVRDMAEGEVFTPENVRSIRPGYGLPPKEIVDILGKKAVRAISRGEPLRREMIS